MTKEVLMASVFCGGSGGGGGTGGSILFVNAVTEGKTTTLDKTWQEIHDAVDVGLVIVKQEEDDGGVLSTMYNAVSMIIEIPNETYGIQTAYASYVALTANGYPEEAK